MYMSNYIKVYSLVERIKILVEYVLILSGNPFNNI